MKRTVIVGCDGQDGRLLFQTLAERGDQVMGIGRLKTRSTGDHGPQAVDIFDASQVRHLVSDFLPDEIYYLAAYHHSAQSRSKPDTRQQMLAATRVHVEGLLNFLQAIVEMHPQARLFYAASSHVFGDCAAPMQNETTPLKPDCVYGITKSMGIHQCRSYRRAHAVYAAAGILYNHESPLRRSDFVSQKIVQASVRIRHGVQQTLVLGVCLQRSIGVGRPITWTP